MHIIITNMSPLKEKENTFATDLGEITGIQTHDAPIRYLFRLLKTKSITDQIRVLPLATPETVKSVEKLAELVKTEAGILEIDAQMLEPISLEESKMESAVCSITHRIQKGDTVYIDTTGGFRNASYLMMAVVRILEYSGVSLPMAIYANVNLNRIMDVTNLYQMFNLINSAELFSSLGNSDGLLHFFENSNSPEIKEALEAMNQFSDAIALCRTSDLSDILRRLNHSLLALENIQTENGGEILFKNLSGMIRTKFGLNSANAEKIDYLDAIRWCLDNKLIQQAVTIYIEKLGEYLFNGGYYSAASSEQNRIAAEKDHFDKYYKLFYCGLMDLKGGISGFFQMAATNDRFKTALTDCNDISSFTNRFNKKDQKKITHIYSELKQYFRVKRSMFNENGDRRPEEDILERLKSHQELQVFLEIKANTVSAFVNELCNNNPRLKHLSSATAETNCNPKFDLIDHLEERLAKQSLYSLNIPAAQMQLIMRDYLFLKEFRNSFNHASDTEIFSEDDKSYFTEHGYKPDADLPLKDINKIIETALEHLNK